MRAFHRPPIVNPWMALYAFLMVLILSTNSELNHDWRTGLVALPFLVSYLLEWLLFRRVVETTEEGISARTLFGERTLRWSQISDVTYKPSTVNKGYTYPAWTRLHLGKQSLAFHSKLKHHDALEREVEEKIKERAGLDLAKVKDAAIDKSFFAGPSYEDLPHAAFGLALLVGSVMFMLRVLR